MRDWVAVEKRERAVLGCEWLGAWLGIARFRIAKDGDCTACTAAYRFGGGWGVVDPYRARPAWLRYPVGGTPA